MSARAVVLACAAAAVASLTGATACRPADSERAANAAPASASADGNAALPPVGATGFDSAGEKFTRLVSQRWIALRDDTERGRYLVRETSVQTCCAQGERESWGTLTVERWRGLSSAEAPLWRTTVAADHGEPEGLPLRPPFYRATLRGCCDSPDVHRFLSLMDGTTRFVLSDAAGRLAAVHVPNARAPLDRWAAWAYPDEYGDIPETRERRDVVAVVQYGGAGGPLQRALLRDASGRYFRLDSLYTTFFPGDSALPDGSLWPADGAADATSLGGFAIRGFLVPQDTAGTGPLVVSIPVQADTFLVAAAVLPAGLTLERLPPVPAMPATRRRR